MPIKSYRKGVNNLITIYSLCKKNAKETEQTFLPVEIPKVQSIHFSGLRQMVFHIYLVISIAEEFPPGTLVTFGDCSSVKFLRWNFF